MSRRSSGASFNAWPGGQAKCKPKRLGRGKVKNGSDMTVTCPRRSGPPDMRVRRHCGGAWNGAQASQTGGDRRQAAAGGGADGTGQAGGGGGSGDRGDGADLLLGGARSMAG